MSNRRAAAADPSRALRVVGYIRVSTTSQREGPAAQRAALERWCERQGAELLAVFEDLGVSGAARISNRPGLLAALDAAGELGAGVVLVAKRDRLARDTMSAAMIERLAERAGARVVSAAGEGTDADPDDPAAQLMRRMIDAFAEYERQIIRARTRMALQTKRRRGERVGQIPYGFRLAADQLHLEEHPEEQKAITLIRRLRAGGLSQRRIVEELNRQLPEAARGVRWHRSTVINLLRREAA